jgi:hypothetical protein
MINNFNFPQESFAAPGVSIKFLANGEVQAVINRELVPKKCRLDLIESTLAILKRNPPAREKNKLLQALSNYMTCESSFLSGKLLGSCAASIGFIIGFFVSVPAVFFIGPTAFTMQNALLGILVFLGTILLGVAVALLPAIAAWLLVKYFVQWINSKTEFVQNERILTSLLVKVQAVLLQQEDAALPSPSISEEIQPLNFSQAPPSYSATAPSLTNSSFWNSFSAAEEDDNALEKKQNTENPKFNNYKMA